VDPFPIFVELKEKLQTVMASHKTLKIFCGVANDFLNMKRDFRVVSALTLDIQLLDCRLRNVPSGGNVKGLKELCTAYLNVSIEKGETNQMRFPETTPPWRLD
jgi:ribonuclease D